MVRSSLPCAQAQSSKAAARKARIEAPRTGKLRQGTARHNKRSPNRRSNRSLHLFDRGAHALQRLAQDVRRADVREAQVAVASRAEGGARERTHSMFLEEAGGELVRGHRKSADVGEGVEGAARLGAAHAGDGAERGDDQVAAAAVL